jgi:hypothetical protein
MKNSALTLDTPECAVAASTHSYDLHSNISTPLLLPPTIATGSMTSEDHCNCGERGTHVVADRAHNSNRVYGISGPLLLPPTIETGSVTSDDHCYCGARGTRVGTTSTQSRDGLSDIIRPLLLPPTMAAGHLTSASYCYYHPQYRRLYDIRRLLLLWGTWHTCGLY